VCVCVCVCARMLRLSANKLKRHMKISFWILAQGKQLCCQLLELLPTTHTETHTETFNTLLLVSCRSIPIHLPLLARSQDVGRNFRMGISLQRREGCICLAQCLRINSEWKFDFWFITLRKIIISYLHVVLSYTL